MTSCINIDLSIFSLRGFLLVFPSSMPESDGLKTVGPADRETVRALSSPGIGVVPPTLSDLAASVAGPGGGRPGCQPPGNLALDLIIPSRISFFSCEADLILALSFKGAGFTRIGRQSGVIFSCDLGHRAGSRLDILDCRRSHDRLPVSCSGLRIPPSEVRRAWLGEAGSVFRSPFTLNSVAISPTA